MRVAVFFTPPPAHPLTAAAARWLMRDAFTGRRFAPEPAPGVDGAALQALTAEPRRYGFHATMKAPFRLAAGKELADAEALLAGFCAQATPAGLPPLRLALLGPFFALVPSAPATAANALAARVVAAFEPLRAPLDEAELARRRRAGLTPAQEAHLAAWGYPYVLDEFRFHMTLTGPVAGGDRETVARLLEERLAPLPAELAIDSLSLFVEDEPGAEFRVHASPRLAGAAVGISEGARPRW